MKRLLASIAALSVVAFVPAAFAQQGSGGYPNGAPGAETASAPASTVKHMRKHHMTNDTSHGNSSIDKSGTTSEAGVSTAGAQGSDQAMGAHAPGNSGGTKTTPSGH